jgi:hypothetical protein
LPMGVLPIFRRLRRTQPPTNCHPSSHRVSESVPVEKQNISAFRATEMSNSNFDFGLSRGLAAHLEQDRSRLEIEQPRRGAPENVGLLGIAQ